MRWTAAGILDSTLFFRSHFVCFSHVLSFGSDRASQLTKWMTPGVCVGVLGLFRLEFSSAREGHTKQRRDETSKISRLRKVL